MGKGSSLVVAVHGMQGTRAVWLPVAHALRSDEAFTLPNVVANAVRRLLGH